MGRLLRAMAFTALLASVGLPKAACKAGGPETSTLAQGQPILDPNLAWHGDNHPRLTEMIRSLGSTSVMLDTPPVAVFDWDNTVIKNDIGDVYLAWLLLNDKIVQPPDKDWSHVSRWFTREARTWLATACDEHPPGAPLPTSTDVDCASAIYGVYDGKKTPEGAPAFTDEGYDHRLFTPALGIPVYAQAGHTLEELEGFAHQAIDLALAADQGSSWAVGHHEIPAWIRIYPESRALISALQDHGFDVWIVSASPEPAVRAFASRVNVDADHVIGIRSVVEADGRLGYDLQGCGPVADRENGIVTYVDGKRCWINRIIFGVDGNAALDVQADAARRPAFVAGDATTDVSMLRDATRLRLVVNRNRGEVMCHAYHDADDKWLINPMYIEPLPSRAEAYPCSTIACMDSEGGSVPCVDDAGEVIGDQEDRVF